MRNSTILTVLRGPLIRLRSRTRTRTHEGHHTGFCEEQSSSEEGHLWEDIGFQSIVSGCGEHFLPLDCMPRARMEGQLLHRQLAMRQKWATGLLLVRGPPHAIGVPYPFSRPVSHPVPYPLAGREKAKVCVRPPVKRHAATEMYIPGSWRCDSRRHCGGGARANQRGIYQTWQNNHCTLCYVKDLRKESSSNLGLFISRIR